MSRNLPETDRKKNQFDKEERVHLLAIMKQYAPLLDTSTSTLARKRIWTIIEEEFKKAGFTRKTSAQLKKYWQNYKYHCKKAKALGKESKRRTNLVDDESLEWNRYQIFVENRATTKFPELSGPLRSMSHRLQSSPIESECHSAETYQDDGSSTGKLNSSDASIDLSRVKTERNEEETESNDRDTEEANPLKDSSFEGDSLDEKKEIFTNEDQPVSPSTNTVKHKKKNRIVVSNSRISNNSVTVSVIYPEECNETDSPSVSKSAEVSWNKFKKKVSDSNFLTPLFDCPNLFERDNDPGNLDRTNGDANNEKIHSFGCNESEDLIRARQMDQDFNGMDERENDVEVPAKCFESRNDSSRSRNCVFLSDYSNRLRHRLLLQQLETEEKRLKVKIAEMSFQEVQLRIKALYEDMRRTEELHRLRLLQMAASTATATATASENEKQTTFNDVVPFRARISQLKEEKENESSIVCASNYFY